VVKDVRGKGLLIGMELDTKIVGARAFVERSSSTGLLSKDTHRDGGAPSRRRSSVGRDELDWGVERIRDALREYGPPSTNALRD
jgi:ornithine--oxo-acid transaminase